MASLLLAVLVVAGCVALVGGQAEVQMLVGEHNVKEYVPQFVLDYAPLIYLHSEEIYAPADIATQLAHTHPTLDGISITDPSNPITLDTLHKLNHLGPNADEIYLTGNEDFTLGADWLHGVLPNANGKTENATSSVVIVNDHGNGLVDAFYLYFFAYNQGGKVLNLLRLGHHVGDWEHTMVRFKNGVPKEAWYSQHGSGTAYTFEILEKRGKRPIGYSANGTHATWATEGTHDHTFHGVLSSWGPLLDCPLWDPLQSSIFYKVSYTTAPPNSTTPTFTPLADPRNNTSALVPSPPASWLSYRGHWGDAQLPRARKAQLDVLGLGLVHRYVGAPNGPRFKQLNRVETCERHADGVWCYALRKLCPGA